jgi:hypothetical protein
VGPGLTPPERAAAIAAAFGAIVYVIRHDRRRG